MLFRSYIDIKDDLSNFRIQKLHEILNTRYGMIDKIQHIRSHEADLLQLCDLIIGAISYNLNDENKESFHKKKIIEKIRQRSGYDLLDSTVKWEEKFNIFKIKI